MKALDQLAMRQEPEAWELLTGGKATLRDGLLDILWSADEFRDRKAELRDLEAIIAHIYRNFGHCSMSAVSAALRSRKSDKNARMD